MHETVGELDKAMYCYTKALEIRLKINENGDINTSKCYEDLGVLYSKIGKLMISEENYQISLEMRKKALGEKHLDVAELSAIASWEIFRKLMNITKIA